MAKSDKNIVWRDRKRTIFGLPWSFTVYELTDEKLLVTKGFISKREDEIRLYRIMDLTLTRSLGQRIFGVGSIHVCSADRSTPELDIKSVKKSRDVKNMLSDMVERERVEKRVSGRELMDDDVGMDGDFTH